MSRYKAYPEYMDSGVDGVGPVPAGWVVKKIKWEISANSGTDVKVDNGEFDLFGANGVIGKTNTTIKNNVDGTILIGRVGSAGAINFVHGNVGISDNAIIIHNFACRAVRFDYYVFLNQNFSELVSKNAQPLITASSIRDIKVPLPSDEFERKTIANFLDHETAKIDTLIAKQQELIKLLKEKRQAVISHAVTKGLNPNAPMRDSGVEWLGEVPAHWPVMQFRRITNLQQGLQIPQEDRFSEPGDNRVEYITVKSINAGSDSAQKEFIFSPSSRVVCKEDDVLLARTGATGQVVTSVEGAFHNNFFKVNYDRLRISKHYLVYFLKVSEVKKHLLMLAGTTTIPDLNHGAFLGTKICLPSMNEQLEICSYLDQKIKQHNFAVENATKFIELLQERRTALISAAVTGKIDVRDWQPSSDIAIAA